jgi:hypothetical protein
MRVLKPGIHLSTHFSFLQFQPYEVKAPLNNIEAFSPTKININKYNKDKLVNVVQGNNSCSLQESYEAHKYNLQVKCRITDC